MPRVVIDTNVWISATLNTSGQPAQVLAAYTHRKFTLVTSEPLLEELSEVLSRPRFVRKYGVTNADRDEFIELLRVRADIIPIEGSVRVCRDPDDDVVIETALRGRAGIVVTRDDDLKSANEVISFLTEAGVTVLSVRQFLASL